MDATARDAYLEAQVLTASPAQLRLLLLDACARWVDETRQALGEGDQQRALDAAIRAREILAELISGIRTDGSDLTRKVLAMYVYLFQTLTTGQLHGNMQQLDDVRELIEIERETWRMVCRQVVATSEQGAAPIQTAPVPASAPTAAGQPAGGSFVLDA